MCEVVTVQGKTLLKGLCDDLPHIFFTPYPLQTLGSTLKVQSTDSASWSMSILWAMD